ncbi:MAG: ABC transporter permease [Chitinophagaceae bacterium]|nr:MAG: ABC transporter permease [Chitinophagaceae bacterium]
MLNYNLRTAWQNLKSHKSYVAINAISLSIGICACLLIFLLVGFETSFDNFHTDKERIYRVVAATKTAAGVQYSKATAYPVAEGLRIDYPRLTKVARIYERKNQQLTLPDEAGNSVNLPDRKFKEQVFFAEPEFFELFNFPFAAGTAKNALSGLNGAVLTKATADKFFGDWNNAIGKLIKYSDGNVFKVSGILENIPSNTDFPLEVVLPFKAAEQQDMPMDWVGQDPSLNTYLLLPENLTSTQFNSELKNFVKKHTPAEFANQGYILQPLDQIHYQSEFGSYRGSTFSKKLITALSLVGLFLLSIACINFINLATAQAVTRSKEVGVRKVLGSSKNQLISQFLTETFLITLVSTIFALGCAFVGLPFLNSILHTSLSIEPGIPLVLFLFNIISVVTILSGLYPAIVLSGFNPLKILQSKFTTRAGGGISLRRVLVVFQFTIAQILIIGTLVVVSQMDLFQNKPTGFDKDAVVIVNIPRDTGRLNKSDALKNQLLQQPGVKNVSLSSFSAMDQASWDDGFKFDNSTRKSEFNAEFKWADNDYFKTYNIEFIAGRSYANADSINGYVVNELLTKKLGFKNPDQIIGKKIDIWDGKLFAPVVGVVKNFNGASLKAELKPTVIGSFKMVYRSFNIKIEPQNAKATLAAIETLWNTTYPDHLYEFQFLDEKIAGFYKQEQQLSLIFQVCAGIAIFISCLGLYGFVSFMAVQRTKEIGIRKVLGASVSSIVLLFSKEFTILISLAFIIATPIAWFVMNKWLEGFAYRVEIGFGFFLATIAIAQLIAWLTVGYQAIRAALANPVKSFRSE